MKDTPGQAPQAASSFDQVLKPVIAELGSWVRATPGTLSLAQGMVGWGPPDVVLSALAEALQQSASSLHRYGSVQGEPPLLEAIQRNLAKQHLLDLAGSALWVTAGSNMAFSAIAQVICGAGAAESSEVILPLPYYFNHVMAIQLAGGLPVPVDAGLIPDLELLEAAITPRTRAIVTVSPNNPSGVVIPQRVLAEINALCAHRGLFHISDEAYGPFVYGDEPHWSPGSASGSSAHTISLYSLSKAYGMAGWRVGYMAAPEQLKAALAKVQDTVLICPPLPIQLAAVAALQAGPAWVGPRVATLADRRRQLLVAVAEQQAKGLPVRLLAEPDGAFYALLQLVVSPEKPAQGGLDSDTVMRRLVLEYRVAVVSGASFGFHGTTHGVVFRLSYGLLDAADLAEALRRLFFGLAEILRGA
jgi:aspartate/methionine/tyrosine aminotransferase